MNRPTDDHIARMIQLDPSETGSGFDAPDHHARTVQHFETAQGRAALRDERAAQDDHIARWLRTWGRGLLWALAGAALALFASAAAPKVAHHIAHPTINSPY